MRKFCLGMALLSFSVATFTWPAVSLAKELLFEGTLTVRVGDLSPVSSEAVGIATINGSGGGTNITTLALPSELFAVSTRVLPTQAMSSISEVQFDFANGAGTLMAATPQAPLVGALPVSGNIRVCVLLSCGFFIDLPLTQNGTRGVGLGGSSITASLLGITIAQQGATWGDATVTLTEPTPAGATSMFTGVGFAHGPASSTQSTATAGGELQIVTPVRITTSLAGTAFPTFAEINLRFLPEPASFGLLALGAAGVAMLGARGRRNR